jgi:hypothetical protein
MVAKTQRPLLELYRSVMEELKVRLLSIDHAVRGATGLSGPLVEDFCYLQLRMSCELVALGCLIAHGDIPGAGAPKLQKEWAADRILRELENLHPEFYPYPIRMTLTPRTATTPGNLHIDRKTEGFLAKSELLSLYGKSGEKLHRGSLKKLLPKNIPVQTRFPDVVAWRDKFGGLLNEHHIASADNRQHIICALNTEHGVTVILGQSPVTGPFVPQEYT